MKKTVIKILTVALIFALGGCASLSRMVKNANQIQYNVDPNPLELEAGKVPVSITVTFPAKYFVKTAYLVVTPYLVSDIDGESEVAFSSQTFQGEKVKDNNPIISYKQGGSFTYKDTIPYQSIYRRSHLELRMNVSKGSTGKRLTVATVQIAKGIITTPELVDDGLLVDNGGFTTANGKKKGLLQTVTPIVAKPQPREIDQNLTLYYPIQQSYLPRKEQKKAEVDTFLNKFAQFKNDPNMEFLGVDIASYASPDGPIPLNHDLVLGRGKTADKFVGKKLKNDITDPNSVLKRETTPDEDWQGFKKLVEQSNIQDKDVILRVLQMYSDPNVREQELKKMAEVWNVLKVDILPKLRRSVVYAKFKTRERTAQEYVNIAKTNPAILDQQELFYAAQNATGADKETIYKQYISKYPNDWRAYNNLAVYYLDNGKLDEALQNFQKADQLDPNNPSVLNNLGVVYWEKGDMAKAKEYFQKAYNLAANNETIGYNLGVIAIKEADYQKAVEYFGAKPTFNKALAQLLAGDAQSAENTINQVSSNCAWLYYLKAVIAARLDKADDVYSNLQKAVSIKPDLKDYAKNDLEFRKYFDEDTFKAIVD